METIRREFEVTDAPILLDDHKLQSEIEKIEWDVKTTKELLDHMEGEMENVDYMNKKIAKLAFGFAYERYESLSKEAEKRGLSICSRYFRHLKENN